MTFGNETYRYLHPESVDSTYLYLNEDCTMIPAHRSLPL